MAALQDELPGTRREEERSLLLDHGDALRAGSRRERVGDKAVQQDAVYGSRRKPTFSP